MKQSESVHNFAFFLNRSFFMMVNEKLEEPYIYIHLGVIVSL